MVQLLHSCGPLFKIIPVCRPQLVKNTYFRPKIRVFSKKKKSSLGIGLQNSYFRPKIRVFSKKKKKGLQLESISKIPILVPKSGCSLKKKRSSIGIDLRSSYFRPKIIAFFKKKVAPTCNRQDLCKIVPRARSWTTLLYIIQFPNMISIRRQRGRVV